MARLLSIFEMAASQVEFFLQPLKKLERLNFTSESQTSHLAELHGNTRK